MLIYPSMVFFKQSFRSFSNIFRNGHLDPSQHAVFHSLIGSNQRFLPSKFYGRKLLENYLIYSITYNIHDISINYQKRLHNYNSSKRSVITRQSIKNNINFHITSSFADLIFPWNQSMAFAAYAGSFSLSAHNLLNTFISSSSPDQPTFPHCFSLESYSSILLIERYSNGKAQYSFFCHHSLIQTDFIFWQEINFLIFSCDERLTNFLLYLIYRLINFSKKVNFNFDWLHVK